MGSRHDPLLSVRPQPCTLGSLFFSTRMAAVRLSEKFRLISWCDRGVMSGVLGSRERHECVLCSDRRKALSKESRLAKCAVNPLKNPVDRLDYTHVRCPFRGAKIVSAWKV